VYITFYNIFTCLCNEWLNLQACKIFNNYLEPTKSICVIMLIPIDNFFFPNFFLWGICFCMISISNLKAIQLPPSPPLPSPPPKQKFKRTITQLVEIMLMFYPFTLPYVHNYHLQDNHSYQTFQYMSHILFYCNFFIFYFWGTQQFTTKGLLWKFAMRSMVTRPWTSWPWSQKYSSHDPWSWEYSIP
jgi:hypothetical protein